MFVFRIAKGRDGGLFSGECPIDFKTKFESTILNDLHKINVGQIPYETNNYIDYLHRELWQCGKLRQGWGIEGLNLLDVLDNENAKSEWIKHYIIGLKKCWSTDPLDPTAGYSENYLPCHEASGRMTMLAQVMLRAKPHDIIFIPKHSFQNQHDENFFTVCEVIGKYYFDLNPLYQDFGHVLSVRNLKTYPYDNEIRGIDFGGFYQRAVSTIEAHHQVYEKLLQFIKNRYLPIISK